MKSLMLVFALLTVLSFGCTDQIENSAAPNPNLAQLISQYPDYTTLQAALIRTNLLDDLTTGNYTIFAPDNAAFIVAGITDINAVPLTKLDSIMKYHLVSQVINSGALPVSDTIKSVLGSNIYASKNTNGRFVNGMAIRMADVTASNGIAHTITNVLMPPSRTISAIAASDTTYSFFVTALALTNLSATVANPGKLTVFIPTNAAFRAAGIVDVNAIPVATLTTIMKYHILQTNVFASDFINNGTVVTSQGGTLTSTIGGVGTIGGAGVQVRITSSVQPASLITTQNIVATNGVIQVINRVMLP
jgi:uncharacterized surface protein with fasciclin (FAS1) repeats